MNFLTVFQNLLPVALPIILGAIVVFTLLEIAIARMDTRGQAYKECAPLQKELDAKRSRLFSLENGLKENAVPSEMRQTAMSEIAVLREAIDKLNEEIGGVYKKYNMV